MNTLRLSLVALLPLSLGLAAQDSTNVEFAAENNQADVFIEKCHTWRNAMRDNDMDLMWTFVEEKFKGPLKPKMAQKLKKVAAKHRRHLDEAGAYVQRSVSLSQETPSDTAQVIVKWDNNGTGSKDIGYVDSCVFEQLPGTTKWVLDI